MTHPLCSSHTRHKLLSIFRETEAVRFGDFTLTSGRKSDFYINARKVSLHRAGSLAIAVGFHEIFRSNGAPDFDIVGGPTSAADPIIGSVLAYSAINNYAPSHGFYWRKEAKTHGTQDQPEGHCPEGARVVLIDDTATTGGSIIQVADYVRNVKKALVVAAFVVADRQEGAREALATIGIPLFSLLTKEDFR